MRVVEKTIFFAALIHTASARISGVCRPGLCGSGAVAGSFSTCGQNDSNMSYVRRPNSIVSLSPSFPAAPLSRSASGTAQSRAPSAAEK